MAPVTQILPETSPEPVKPEEIEPSESQPDRITEPAVPDQPFNFGLPGESMDMQNQERVGMEERLVTLEIKLMDFEYALSRMQAGSTIPSHRSSQNDRARRQTSLESYTAADSLQSRSGDSPLPQQGESKFPNHKYSNSADTDPLSPKTRPTSIATTLKPGTHQGTYTSPEKPPLGVRSTRMSLTGLTIEHYTALITLIRHEQAARQRLEEQVAQLQSQIDRVATMSHSRHASSSQHSHSLSQSSQQRRRGIVEPEPRRRGTYLHQRPQSSSYSLDRTDTDDESFHDAYVTPSITPMDFNTERGEFERGAFERISVEEGVAF